MVGQVVYMSVHRQYHRNFLLHERVTKWQNIGGIRSWLETEVGGWPKNTDKKVYMSCWAR